MVTGLCLGEFSLMHPEHFSAKSIVAFIYLTLVGSLVGFTSYIWLLKNVGVAKTSTYAFVNPVVAVLLGWMFGGEVLNFHIVTAAALVVVAVIVITYSQSKEIPVVKKQ
jgi:drug/metabolite transporter (DMT)-like permease